MAEPHLKSNPENLGNSALAMQLRKGFVNEFTRQIVKNSYNCLFVRNCILKNQTGIVAEIYFPLNWHASCI